jgi:RNA polymerase sigma-70 factor (ECF subfamily)
MLDSDTPNEQWLAALRGPDQSAALDDLRALLVRGLRIALAGRLDGDLDTMVEDFAQDALLRILRSLDTFRGESRFTTWAHKIAVRVAFSELRRQRWRDVSLQDLISRAQETGFTPDALADPTPNPEIQTTRQMTLATIKRLIEEELTDRQRQAMQAAVEGMPLEEVARRMGTNRNALYKLLHDARLRLQKRMMASEGLSPQDVLAVFGDG